MAPINDTESAGTRNIVITIFDTYNTDICLKGSKWRSE